MDTTAPYQHLTKNQAHAHIKAHLDSLEKDQGGKRTFLVVNPSFYVWMLKIWNFDGKKLQSEKGYKQGETPPFAVMFGVEIFPGTENDWMPIPD